MYKYSDIIYVGSSKPLICRDGNKQWADSMDLKFITYSELVNGTYGYKNNVLIIDISVGWTTLEDLADIESVLPYYSSKIFIRLVDQFKHQLDSPVYQKMIEISKSYNIKIIGTYNVDYYGLDVLVNIPYPYLLEECEVNDYFRINRYNKIILTGSDIKEIYPLRCKLYDLHKNGSKYIDIIKHPGYSGSHWNSPGSKLGISYLKELSNYKFMACTTCIEGYELLKYVECAERDCIPVGELPPSLIGTEAEDYFIKIPDYALSSMDSFDKWFEDNLLSKSEYELRNLVYGYKDSICSLNNKESLKDLLLVKINS